MFQKLLHPDRFGQAETEMQNNSTTLSSFANNAYFTLVNDLERAVYLVLLSVYITYLSLQLKLKGIEALGEEDKMKDMELMEEVFEIRTEIECCDSDEALQAIQMDI